MDFETIQRKIDDKLKDLPALDRAKAQMGTQVWDGYFTFKNDLTKRIDLLKRSTAGSGDLAKFLGAPITEGENAGKTWSDVLESQGFASWDNVKKLKKGQAPDLAFKLSNGKTKDITQISRARYMQRVLPELKNRIMRNNYGKWYTMIEGGLKNAQAGETKKHQDAVNSDETDTGRQEPDPSETEVEPPPQELQSAIPEPPANAQGGPVATVPRPEQEQQFDATEQDMAQLAQKNEAQRQKELAEETAREEQRKKEFGEWKLSAKQEANLEGEKKKAYKKFKDWMPRLLEKSKDNPEFLEVLRKEYEKTLKKKKAKGKQHHWEDYNLAYIKYLLNK